MSIKKTTEEFIAESKLIFGEDKYTYGKTRYISNKTPLIITCVKHGDFKVRPGNHLFRHSGCPYCSKKHVWSTDEIINRFKEVHGDKYDYSKVEYINSATKICIICPEHGEFWKLPNEHLNGQGCQKCSYENLSKKYLIDTEQFIEKAKKVHGDKYEYKNSKYTNAHSDIVITCKKHGNFTTKAYMHLQGVGCPKCNQSHLETEVENILKHNGIYYEQQKHFKWLGLQSLDFYLPEYNVAIECQGEQHFKPVEVFGGKLAYEKVKTLDLNKANLCKENGINLFYFTHYVGINEEGNIYKNKDKLLENILNDVKST